jgi:hypothetical protein
MLFKLSPEQATFHDIFIFKSATTNRYNIYLSNILLQSTRGIVLDGKNWAKIQKGRIQVVRKIFEWNVNCDRLFLGLFIVYTRFLKLKKQP